MAKFVSGINTGGNVYQTFKTAAATTINDIGKPVKLSATDEVALTADGEQIYGFIASVDETQKADGKVLVSVLTSGRCYVILSGASAVGTIVESHTNTAAGTAKAGNYGLVSTHTLVAGTMKQWLIISSAGGDGDVALIEKQ